MLTPVKQYTFGFTSDGISTSLAVDCSIVPISENFAGNAPAAVLSPVVTSVAGGTIAGVTAALAGHTVTFTFPGPPPKNDINGNLILYTVTFYLQYNL
jgi:hypothetical protein